MGELTRAGESRPATPHDLDFYERAQGLQALQRVPVLQPAGDPHAYVFYALFDGTRQDAEDPDQLPTNIGVLKRRIEELRVQPAYRIGGEYVEGIGARGHFPMRDIDALIPQTWDDKIEQAYMALANQTRDWQHNDPEARVTVVGVGYSRGAVLAAGLARLVDRYGIADPADLKFGRDAHGNITVDTTRAPLVAPGQAAQAIAVFDPVGTSLPRNFDARLPASVVSALALAAAHERRESFPHQALVEPGLSQDARFANLLLPGGHSNVGGGNRAPGLEIGAYNVMADYLNGLHDAPLFGYRALPREPSQYTVFQMHGPTALPGMDKDGLRNVRTSLANCKVVDPCRNAAPSDPALVSRFEYRALSPQAPVPTPAQLQPPAATRTPDDARHPDHALLQQIRRGVDALDFGAGALPGDACERLSRSLLAACKDSPGRDGLSSAPALGRADHVVLGLDGRNVFVVQGGLADPAHRRIAVDAATALRTPVADSDARLETANRAHAREREAPSLHTLDLPLDASMHVREPDPRVRTAPPQR